MSLIVKSINAVFFEQCIESADQQQSFWCNLSYINSEIPLHGLYFFEISKCIEDLSYQISIFNSSIWYCILHIFILGRVKRTICFSLHESCRCLATMAIDVINCGSFYIYKTPASQPRCYSRICLEKQRQRKLYAFENFAFVFLNSSSFTLTEFANKLHFYKIYFWNNL